MVALDMFHVIDTTIVNSFIMLQGTYDSAWQVGENNATFEVQCGFG
jgi:hypothetical protein